MNFPCYYWIVRHCVEFSSSFVHISTVVEHLQLWISQSKPPERYWNLNVTNPYDFSLDCFDQPLSSVEWDGEGLWEKKRIKLGCTCLSIISKRIVQKWLLLGLFSYPSFQFWSIKVIPEENQVRYSVRNGISISIILPFSYTISFSFNPWHLLP